MQVLKAKTVWFSLDHILLISNSFTVVRCMYRYRNDAYRLFYLNIKNYNRIKRQ